MIKKNHILVFLFLAFGFASIPASANKNADSLRALIGKSDNDTLKVNCWNKISMIYSNEGRFSLAEQAGFEALDLANRSDFKRGIGDAYYQIGIAFSKQAKYDVAMEWYLKARTQYEKIGNKSGLGFTYLLIGVIDYYLHNNDKAEENYKKAIKYFEEANDRAGKANVKINLAYLYMEAKKKVRRPSMKLKKLSPFLNKEIPIMVWPFVKPAWRVVILIYSIRMMRSGIRMWQTNI